jgi:anti-sigma factor RsiW
MDCKEFLERYSEYRDGRIFDAEVRRRMFRHRSTCPRCARYDAVLSAGVRALRSLAELEPSGGFQTVLKARLRSAPLAPGGLLQAGPVAAALLLAAAATLFFLEGVAASFSEQERKALPVVVVNPGLPFVSFASVEDPIPWAVSPDLPQPSPAPARWATAP